MFFEKIREKGDKVIKEENEKGYFELVKKLFDTAERIIYRIEGFPTFLAAGTNIGKFRIFWFPETEESAETIRIEFVETDKFNEEIEIGLSVEKNGGVEVDDNEDDEYRLFRHLISIKKVIEEIKTAWEERENT
ncbi:hypothetical protein KAR26_04280 [Candidatus Parcubacteria bacterium]|nr:hypothetical protein [Candidatus Parcubacteria bacterium]